MPDPQFRNPMLQALQDQMLNDAARVDMYADSAHTGDIDVSVIAGAVIDARNSRKAFEDATVERAIEELLAVQSPRFYPRLFTERLTADDDLDEGSYTTRIYIVNEERRALLVMVPPSGEALLANKWIEWITMDASTRGDWARFKPTAVK